MEQRPSPMIKTAPNSSPAGVGRYLAAAVATAGATWHLYPCMNMCRASSSPSSIYCGTLRKPCERFERREITKHTTLGNMMADAGFRTPRCAGPTGPAVAASSAFTCVAFACIGRSVQLCGIWNRSKTLRGARGTANSLVCLAGKGKEHFENYTRTQIGQALRMLGYTFPKQIGKADLLRWIASINIPLRPLYNALRDLARGKTHVSPNNSRHNVGNNSRGKSQQKSLWDFDAKQLRVILTKIGIYSTKEWGKRQIIEVLEDLEVNARDVKDVLKGESNQNNSRGSSKQKSENNSGGRSKQNSENNSRGTSKQKSLWDFDAKSLRVVLNLIGIYSTKEWGKSRIIEELEDLDVNARDVKNILKEKSPETYYKHENRKGSRSKTWERKTYSDKARKKKNNNQQTYNEEDWADTIWMENHGWVHSFVEDDLSDYEPELEDFVWGHSEHGPRSRSYESFSNNTSSFAWQNNNRTTQAASSSRPTEDPNVVMARAIREGWKQDTLSRSQASRLLGVSLRPSSVELSGARKKMILQCHPDHNQDDPHASQKLSFVMAAVSVLS